MKMTKIIRCEFCGHEIVGTIFKVIGTNKKDFNVEIFYYDALCFEELSSEFRKKYGENAIMEVD
jgi:UDP-N-acetylmuramyl tripeptide synthase